MMETMIPPQVGMRLRTLKINKRGQRSSNKKRGQRSPPKRKKKRKKMRENKKMREKERRGNVTILLPHLCFRVAPCSSYRESPTLSLSYTSGNFHYRTWLVYSNDGLPQMPQVFMSKQVGCTPTQFQFELSYTYSSSASVAWQSLLLTLTSIDGHLHSPLISRVDVRLSPFFVFSTQPPSSYSIPPIVLYPWLTLMYCVKVEKV